MCKPSLYGMAGGAVGPTGLVGRVLMKNPAMAAGGVGAAVGGVTGHHAGMSPDQVQAQLAAETQRIHALPHRQLPMGRAPNIRS